MSRKSLLALLLATLIAGVAFSIILFAQEEDGTTATKTISYTGSSTIGDNIIPEAFDVFSEEAGIEIGTIDNPGSGKGIEAVLNGNARLAGASRPLKEDELRSDIYRQIIAYDAIVVFVAADNPISLLTKEQVKAIFTGRIRNWADVGGRDAKISVITETLGDQRATMLEFQKLAMDGADYLDERKEVDKPTDQVDALINDPNGIISVSIASTNPKLKAITIDSIAPDADNVRSGAYLISRPLVLVTKGQPGGSVKEFLEFIVSTRGQTIVEQNFVPIK